MKSSRQCFEASRQAGFVAHRVPKGPELKRRGTLATYLSWLRPFRRTIAGVFALSVVSSAIALLLPLATKHIIDEVLPARDLSTLHLIGAGLLVLIVLQQAFDFLRNWQVAKLGARILFSVRQRVFTHLLHLPLQRLSELKTGGIASRVSGDVDSTKNLFQLSIITGSAAVLRVVLTVTVLLYLSWRLSLAAALLLPLLLLVSLRFVHRIRPIYRAYRHDRAEIDGRVVETFGGIRVVRAFGRERTEALRYAIGHHTAIRKRLLANLYEFAVLSGWGLLVPLAALVTIWLGGALVLKGMATVGTLVAFQMYLAILLVPVVLIVKSYGDMQQGIAALERLLELLSEPREKPDRPQAVNAPTRIETVAFEDVSFSYDEEHVLRSLDLRVRGGSTVALVGPSGSGKTTITNLLMRFFEPDQGAVRINGIDLRDIKLASYRGLIGLVSQDVFLYDGTVAENIAYGHSSASFAEIELAARRAGAHEFIERLPDGYDTQVGERGARLSGGEAQRVSIARAILADPQILILDEATSNLDSQTEQAIQDGLNELLGDRTTFVVAHRLSTVVDADLIVVLERGGVVETGTHEQLMAAAGAYRAMVERQFRRPDAEAHTDVTGLGGL